MHGSSLTTTTTMDILVATATILAAVLLLVLLLPGHRRSKLPPGPRPWPILGNLPHLGPAPHKTLAAMATTYGPLLGLRFGSVPVVVAASARIAALFLKVHDANFASRPPSAGSKHISYDGHDLAFAPYGPRWRALRKICSLHLFSGKALNDFKHVREEEVADLVGSLLRRRAGGGDQVDVNVVNLSELLNVCTANALGRALMGRRVFEEGGGKEAGEFKEMVVEAMVLAGVFNIGDFIPALDWLDLQGVVGKMKRLHCRFDAFLGRIVDEHRARYSNRHDDMLSALMGNQTGDGDVDGDGGEGGLSDTEIKALLLNLFIAGTDTSSSTVEWAMAELIRHPDILAQLRQELDSVFGYDRMVTDLDLTELPILQAVIKENFRLHPSTPLSLPRVATNDCDVDGYQVPKGTTLLVNIWAIGRDPEVWKNPLEFRPARFLPGGEAANVDVRGGDFELIPFGSGRRICAGLGLGLKMVLLMTASLVHAFDWGLPIEQTAEKLNMEEAYGLTLQRAAPLKVCPLPRLNPSAYKSIGYEAK